MQARLREFADERDEDGESIVTPEMVSFARELLEELARLDLPTPDDVCSGMVYGRSVFAVAWWQAGRQGEPRRTNMRHSVTVWIEAKSGEVKDSSPSQPFYGTLAEYLRTMYNAALIVV